MRREMPAIWGLIKPLVVYYIGYYVIRMVVGTLLAGSGMVFLMESGSTVVNGIAMLGGCVVLFPMIEEEKEEERKEKKRREEEKAGGKNSVPDYLALAVFAVSSVVFFNTLVSLSGISEQSAAFQETAKNQYAVSLGMGLFLYAGVSAVAEEIVFRFLLYNRLRRSGGRVAFGVVGSAFLFAVYHGNIVQGVYAFVLGILIACAYVYFDHFFAPVLFHGLGNAVIFLSNMIPGMYDIVFSPVLFWVFGLITVAGCLYFATAQGLIKRKQKTDKNGSV
ncbi:MAG: CPBP family intramembrane metalloprotease [Lachnospiraceae bacterium]|nr:CPBP family intramembrane metalloprotease [Lachnospiraceae bacterium]